MEIETSAVVADMLKNYISVLSFAMEFTEREGEEGGRVGRKRERVKRTLLVGEHRVENVILFLAQHVFVFHCLVQQRHHNEMII